MSAVLTRPSFWTEPRDPGSWQRALRRIAEIGAVPEPWPAWEEPLRGVLPRRAIPGLYGVKEDSEQLVVLGVGFLERAPAGWLVSREARTLLDLDRVAFEEALLRWLVARSPWVRLALRALATGDWTWPRGLRPLMAARTLRVGEDLDVHAERLTRTVPAALGGQGMALRVDVPARSLSALHAPLYLLRAHGWLDGQGRPALPDALAPLLLPGSPASLLRQITEEEADGRGFVPVSRVACRLRQAVRGGAHDDLAAWSDAVLGAAIARGTLEVHAWAPGQPRHGRGLHGDRDRKLVRWTVHDDFDLSGGAP